MRTGSQTPNAATYFNRSFLASNTVCVSTLDDAALSTRPCDPLSNPNIICRAFSFDPQTVHEHDIIHRDIKPDNLLRSKDGTVKIVDFGVSEMFDKKVGDKTKKSAGSPAFMAPEL